MENFTLPVPVGTTSHGNPNLICTPVSITDSFIFFFVNYFAHAFTVKQLPGEKITPYMFAILAASLYPYYGLPRGIESIIRRAIFFRSSELQTACRAGALCIVVRSKIWTPVEGQTPIQRVVLEHTNRHFVTPMKRYTRLSQPDDVELGTVDNSSRLVSIIIII